MKHQHTAGTGSLLLLTSQPTRATGSDYGPYINVTVTGDVVTAELGPYINVTVTGDVVTAKLTKHMEKNPSEEADSSSAILEIIRI